MVESWRGEGGRRHTGSWRRLPCPQENYLRTTGFPRVRKEGNETVDCFQLQVLRSEPDFKCQELYRQTCLDSRLRFLGCASPLQIPEAASGSWATGAWSLGRWTAACSWTPAPPALTRPGCHNNKLQPPASDLRPQGPEAREAPEPRKSSSLARLAASTNPTARFFTRSWSDL